MKSDRFSRSFDLLCATMVEVTGHVVGEGLPDGMISRILGCALDLFSARGAYVICAWDGGELMKYSARRGALPGEAGLVEKRILPGWSGLAGRARSAREQVSVACALGDGDFSAECDFLSGAGGGSLLIAPMRVGREATGVVGLIGRDEELLADGNRRFLQVLADQAGVALRAAEKHHSVERLGLTDSLTCAYNYRFLLEAIEKEIGRSRRYGETFSLVMLDVDNLKTYNDVHGHLRGSQVLRRVALLARRQLRSVDVLAKYGGDEFVIVLPKTGREGANLVAERVRRAIAEHAFPGEDRSGCITSSLGLSVFPVDGSSVEDLIDAADQALYRAKRLGRNRVSAGVEEARVGAGGEGEACELGSRHADRNGSLENA